VEHSIPNTTLLFQQLGLGSTPEEIDAFVASHSPLPTTFLLADANFWTQSQAGFLRSEVARDTVWSVVIDRLDTALRMTR